MESLDRFLDAQRHAYAQALAELQAGAKHSHWIWFIFPQLAGLSRSETARFYALADLAEARAYLAHPLLGQRLTTCTEAMLAWAGKRTAETVLGSLDALKFRSSMTLFEAAGGGAVFTRAIEMLCDGKRDQQTLALLEATGQGNAPC